MSQGYLYESLGIINKYESLGMSIGPNVWDTVIDPQRDQKMREPTEGWRAYEHKRRNNLFKI